MTNAFCNRKPKSRIMKRCFLNEYRGIVLECSGYIIKTTKIDYCYGFNTSNKERVLLRKLKINEKDLEHIWVECKELNNLSRNLYVTFNAEVGIYRKKNGQCSYCLINLVNIKILEKKLPN